MILHVNYALYKRSQQILVEWYSAVVCIKDCVFNNRSTNQYNTAKSAPKMLQWLVFAVDTRLWMTW